MQILLIQFSPSVTTAVIAFSLRHEFVDISLWIRQGSDHQLMLSPITVSILLRGWGPACKTGRPSKLRCYSSLNCRTLLDLRQPAGVHNLWWRTAPSVLLSMCPIQSSVTWIRHPIGTNARRPQGIDHKKAITPFGASPQPDYEDPPGVDLTQAFFLPLPSTSLDPEHSQRPENMATEHTTDYFCPPAMSNPPTTACSVCLDLYDDHGDRYNATLLDLRRETCNVVLDSPCPRIIPHIVLTPPTPSPYDYYTPPQNRVDLQWPGFLTVPSLPMQIFQYATPGPRSLADSGDAEPRLAVCRRSKVETQHRPPMKVFSSARLSSTIRSSVLERVFLGRVCDALKKYVYKTSAHEASMLGPSVCERFRSNHLKDTDKPFTWVDPATPILQTHRGFNRGQSILLESDSPFTVPHILIIDEPPQDPWIAWSNGVNQDQDDDFLGVHPHSWSYMAAASCSTPELSESGWETDSDATSLCELEEEGERASFGKVSGGPCDAGEFFGEDIEPVHVVVLDGDEHRLQVQPPTYRSGPVFQMDDDDDDELPPFDDWYTSILERSNAKSDLS